MTKDEEIEWLRNGWVRAERLLRQVYYLDAPRGDKGRKVSAAKFASLTRRQVDRWDFPNRHLMHKIAKALSR